MNVVGRLFWRQKRLQNKSEDRAAEAAGHLHAMQGPAGLLQPKSLMQRASRLAQ